MTAVTTGGGDHPGVGSLFPFGARGAVGVADALPVFAAQEDQAGDRVVFDAAPFSQHRVGGVPRHHPVGLAAAQKPDPGAGAEPPQLIAHGPEQNHAVPPQTACNTLHSVQTRAQGEGAELRLIGNGQSWV